MARKRVHGRTVKQTDWTNVRGNAKMGHTKCKVHGPWREHWEALSRKKFPKSCTITYIDKKTGAEVDCSKKATLGAHIRRLHPGKSNLQYIVPACGSCNKRGGKKPGTEAHFVRIKKYSFVRGLCCSYSAGQKKRSNKKPRVVANSLKLPGQANAPPPGKKLKSGYYCRKVKGIRRYFSPTGRKSKERNACK